MMTRQLAILGSTGSIGTNALRVVTGLEEEFEIYALSAHTRIDLLADQVEQVRPRVVALTQADKVDTLHKRIRHLEVEILTGPEALVTLAQDPLVDTVLNAIVGAAGLPSALAAAQAGKCLAIANKEPLVVAGQLLMQAARENQATILPIDSEHSAVFQALLAGRPEEVTRIILTGSGGPFRQATSAADLEKVTVEQALNHPTWAMGPKITIDSATMMNKALEIIEAHWLFDLPVDQIEALIHPESIIHSIVEFIDGSMIAQMGPPDMCLPIQYALTYPKRRTGITQHLNLAQLGQLNFEPPNPTLFRALPLTYEVAKAGGTTPAVFNAANEAAVAAFLDGRIPFPRIMQLVETCLDQHDREGCNSLPQLLAADHWARDQVKRQINRGLSRSK